MNKTVALFVFAVLLLGATWFMGIITGPPCRPPPQRIESIHARPSPQEPLIGASQIILGDRVKLEGTLSNAFVVPNQGGTLHLLMDLVAHGSEETGRAPLAIALVIDRSGSMAGDKMNKARMAAQAFAARLADVDQIAIVSYSSDAVVDLPLTHVKGQRERIARVIGAILDGGGTDIGAGLNLGMAALRNSAPGSVRRMMLVSDGNANQGITDPEHLAALARRGRDEGITLSGLGIGVDFNEDLLAAMSQEAGGAYYYAPDAQAIAVAFDRELAGIHALAARSVTIGLELGHGVQVTEVFGYRTEMDHGRLEIHVGDMADGEKRRVLLTLNTSPTATKLEVANVVLSYAAPDGTDPREHRSGLSVLAGSDLGQVQRAELASVAEAVVSARAAKAREHAAASFQSGNKNVALDRLSKQIQEARRANASLRSVAVQAQVTEMEETVRNISSSSNESDDGKDLVKREKLRARQIFAY